MGVFEPDLSLIAFAAPGICEDARRLISGLGYHLAVEDGLAWKPDLAPRPPPTTAFMIGRMDYPRGRVLGFLDECRGTRCLVIAASPEEQWDCELLARCAEFVRWPCAQRELALRLERVCGKRRTQPPKPDPLALNLIGESPGFRAAIALIPRTAHCDAPVLIEGETGSGKELVAHAIHYLGPRRGGPFVPVNCGAIPDELVENELFGHERGAFTDAREPQPGLVAQASGGTLFLDEVDALSEKVQVSLLRFLQDRQFRPLGASVMRTVDIRVIAASNRDLRALSMQGAFRADLLFRLDVMQLRLPPLRERPGDVPLLAGHIVSRLRDRYGGIERRLHPDALAQLACRRWPGNVRELENTLHRAFLLTEGPWITLVPDASPGLGEATAPRPGSTDSTGGFRAAKASMVTDFERGYLQSLLAESAGNVSEAARRAGKERRALGKLLKKHGIDARAYR